MTIQIIETQDVERDYGFRGTNAIVQHPAYGRLLLSDGYGGEGTLQGGAVRWQHGAAVKLLDGDTIASLKIEPWNDHMTLWEAVRSGCDDTRPMLLLDGHAMAAVAKAVGL